MMYKLALASLIAGSAAAFTSVSNGPRIVTSLNARKPFISGNWKLNPQSKAEALTLASDIAASITDSSPDCDVALFVPYVFIESAMGVVGDKLNVGAEVCYSNLCTYPY
jgi:triosephosphate isomerase (TIM)